MQGIRSFATTSFMLASFATSAAAQQPRIVVGPMAGVSFSTLSGDDVSDNVFFEGGYRTGFAAGGFVSFNANTHLAIEPQLLYVQKGARFTSGTQWADYELDYIEVPFLVKGRYWFGPAGRPFTLNGFAGPAIAFNVHCGFSSSDFNAPCDPDGSNFLKAKTLDLSVLIGAGAEYFGFSFQARYDMSMTNAYASTSSGEPDARNRSWILTLGYKIPVR